METFKEGGAIGRPPLLDGSNYAYWKARMRAFIKAIDEQAWKSVLTGWIHPTVTDAEGKTTRKAELKWTTLDDRLANGNYNAIFNAVNQTQFKLISTREMENEAWEILETAHEGTDVLKLSKLQILTTRFENLKMEEEETITNFNGHLCDIANEAFALGERISEEKLVRKALRSLPKRFVYKVTAIEEAKDVRKMRLDEMIGSLRTFEMTLEEDRQEKKDRSIAFQVESQKNSVATEESEQEPDDLEESLALLTKNFSHFVKKFGRTGQGDLGGPRNFQKNIASLNTVKKF